MLLSRPYNYEKFSCRRSNFDQQIYLFRLFEDIKTKGKSNKIKGETSNFLGSWLKRYRDRVGRLSNNIIRVCKSSFNFTTQHLCIDCCFFSGSM